MPFVSVIAASVSAFPSLFRVVDHDNDQNQKSDTVQAKQNIEQCGDCLLYTSDAADDN